MSLMFNDCKELSSIDLSTFITSKVKTFSHMFAGCEKLTSVDVNFDARQANDLSYLFFDCLSLQYVNMSLLKTEQEVNIDYMLYNCESLLNIDFGLNYYDVNSMAYTFHKCINLNNINLIYFDVTDVTTMKNLFYSCKNISYLDLSSFNTNNCRIFDDMFGECNEMNVTIYPENNKELIKSAPENIHFIEQKNLEIDFLYE